MITSLFSFIFHNSNFKIKATILKNDLFMRLLDREIHIEAQQRLYNKVREYRVCYRKTPYLSLWMAFTRGCCGNNFGAFFLLTLFSHRFYGLVVLSPFDIVTIWSWYFFCCLILWSYGLVVLWFCGALFL